MTLSHEGPPAPGTGLVVLDEYASDDILIDRYTERAGYLLGNLSAAEARVASFHLDNRVDEFS